MTLSFRGFDLDTELCRRKTFLIKKVKTKGYGCDCWFYKRLLDAAAASILVKCLIA